MSRIQELLSQAESAVGRNNTGEAVRIIIDVLQEVASGTLNLTVEETDPKNDLKDDIEFFKAKSKEAAARGDSAETTKNAKRAALLIAAETLVAKKEDNK